MSKSPLMELYAGYISATTKQNLIQEEEEFKHPKGGIVALTHEGEHVTHFTDAKSHKDIHDAVVKHLVAHHGFDEKHAKKAHDEVSHDSDPDYLAHPSNYDEDAGNNPTHKTTVDKHAKAQARKVSREWGGPRKSGDK